MDTIPIKVVVFHCRNLRLFSNGQQKEFARARPGVKLVAIPCSGKIEAHHLLETLAAGAHGALVLACAEKACQYLEGSKRSHKRVDYARQWLDKLGMETDRLEFIHIPPTDTEALDKLLKEFADKLESFEKTLPIAQTQPT